MLEVSTKRSRVDRQPSPSPRVQQAQLHPDMRTELHERICVWICAPLALDALLSKMGTTLLAPKEDDNGRLSFSAVSERFAGLLSCSESVVLAARALSRVFRVS